MVQQHHIDGFRHQWQLNIVGQGAVGAIQLRGVQADALDMVKAVDGFRVFTQAEAHKAVAGQIGKVALEQLAFTTGEVAAKIAFQPGCKLCRGAGKIIDPKAVD